MKKKVFLAVRGFVLREIERSIRIEGLLAGSVYSQRDGNRERDKKKKKNGVRTGRRSIRAAIANAYIRERQQRRENTITGTEKNGDNFSPNCPHGHFGSSFFCPSIFRYRRR